jgi:catechol 2,3-dioxygenase-like lactoylglutathione lyase family enzyme
LPNSPTLKLVVLKTLDVDRLLNFYRTLGIRFSEEQHGKGPLHYSATVGGMVFEIYPAAALDAAEPSVRLGFEVPDLAATVQLLRSSGTTIGSEPKESPWGVTAVVRDPDGRAVELYQRP